MATSVRITKQKSNPAAMLIGLAAIGVGGFIVMKQGIGGAGGLRPLQAGESLRDLRLPEVVGGKWNPQYGSGVHPLAEGPVTFQTPTVAYVGPGRDTYTCVRITQELVLNGKQQEVTVYASGLAARHIDATATPVSVKLVASDQLQPDGSRGAFLWAFPSPGNDSTAICGHPPVPGLATIYIEIYEKRYAIDGDGFVSVTCPHDIGDAKGQYRTPLQGGRTKYPGVLRLT